MNKKLIVVISILFFVFLIPQITLAYQGDINSESYEGIGVKVEGELSPIEPSNPVEPFLGKAIKNVSVISGPVKTKRFVRYLTGSWAKASSYTWSKTQSASSTVSTDVGASAKVISSKLGVSNTVSTSYSVAITIPASSTKFSKLAFYSDFNKRHVKVWDSIGPAVFNIKYGDHYAPTKDTYLQVVYQ